MAVDVSAGSTSDGANIIQWGYGNADNQKWKFESVGGGAFEISSQKSGS
ncbi:RICIN domain-containing protein [Lentzea indica]|nr:RICIN domain-containing protein [Lentzea indica]